MRNDNDEILPRRVPHHMIILGLDSASGACSAAVAGPNGVIAYCFEAMMRGQSEALAPMIADVLDDAVMRVGEVDALAVTIGPGAFTGVRIGLSAARALALAAGKPLVGVTTFAAVAEPLIGPAGHILSVIESRREDFFFQLIERASGIAGPPRAAYDAEIVDAITSDGFDDGPLVLCGDGAARLIENGALADIGFEVADGPGLPDARGVIVTARRCIDREGLPDRSARPSPLYLRPPDVGPARFA